MAVKEKVRVKVKGYDHTVVDAAAAKIVETAKRTGSRTAGPVPLPTNKEVVTILRAVHKYKDSREQFEQALKFPWISKQDLRNFKNVLSKRQSLGRKLLPNNPKESRLPLTKADTLHLVKLLLI